MAVSQFFDIQSILVEDQLALGEMQLDGYNLQQLEYQSITLGNVKFDQIQQDEEQTLLAETKLKCPVWLAIPLASQNFLKLKIPKWYEQQFLELAQAGPLIVNLKEKNSFFFQFGSLLSNRLKRLAIKKQISEVLFNRLKELVLINLHGSNQTLGDFIKRLTDQEFIFYQMIRDHVLEYQVWRDYQILDQRLAETLVNKKRLKQNQQQYKGSQYDFNQMNLN